MFVRYLILVVMALCSQTAAQYATSSGTTPNFEKIFVGRCWDRTETQPYYQSLAKQNITFNCTYIYEQFASAYYMKDPLSITNTSFQGYLQAAWHPIPPNQSVFWTGSSYVVANPGQPTPITRDVVHQWSDNGYRYWTLEDSLWGYILNGLSWCGSFNQTGNPVDIWNYTACPAYGLNGSTSFFWNSASAQFAQSASGNAQFLGYASQNINAMCAASAATFAPAQQSVTVACPSGATIYSIIFASLVSLNTTASNCTQNNAATSCSAPTSILSAANKCVGQATCTLTAAPSAFTSCYPNTTGFYYQFAVNYNCLSPRLIWRNGTNPSTFASVELYNINPAIVTSFSVLIIPDPSFPTESCNEGSVAGLQWALQYQPGGPMFNASQISCQNNPAGPRHIMCVDNINASSCDFSSSSDDLEVGAIGGVIGLIAGAAIASIGVYLLTRKSTKDALLLGGDA